MPLIGNNADALLHGLSDFWIRFFEDVGDLKHLYEGTELLLGQVYLDILTNVLNTSVLETPLFKKEYFRPITIRGDKLTYVDTGIAGQARYVFDAGAFLADLPHIQNKVYAPTAALEVGSDYDIVEGDLAFTNNPTNPPVAGFATRPVDVSVAGTFTAPAIDWTVVNAQPGDFLVLSDKYDASSGTPSNAITLTICHVTAGTLAISLDTPIPGKLATGYSWHLARKLTTGVTTILAGQSAFTGVLANTTVLSTIEISGWAIDARVDFNVLHDNYGYLVFNRQRPSSESYRAFIRGIMQLYTLGPALERMQSALNLIADLPVVRDDGEVLLDYDAGVNFAGVDGSLTGNVLTSASANWGPSDIGGYVKIEASNYAANIGTFRIVGYTSPTTVTLLPPGTGFVNDTSLKYRYSYTNTQVVTTDKNAYVYPIDIPMRPDVVDPLNIGSLTFKSFETLTIAVNVTDYVKDPQWWHHITIPQELLPDFEPSRRVVTPDLYPNTLGTDNGDLRVGDPGFYVGADDAGNVTSNPFHHTAAFILMDSFLKFHMFLVDIDRNIDLSGTLIQDMQSLLRDLKPAQTYVYFQPVTTFTDSVTVTDTLTLEQVLTLFETFGIVNNALAVDGTWSVGDAFQYSGASGGAVTYGSGAGFCSLVVGGENPHIDLPGSGNAIIDRTLYVNAHV